MARWLAWVVGSTLAAFTLAACSGSDDRPQAGNGGSAGVGGLPAGGTGGADPSSGGSGGGLPKCGVLPSGACTQGASYRCTGYIYPFVEPLCTCKTDVWECEL